MSSLSPEDAATLHNIGVDLIQSVVALFVEAVLYSASTFQQRGLDAHQLSLLAVYAVLVLVAGRILLYADTRVHCRIKLSSGQATKRELEVHRSVQHYLGDVDAGHYIRRH